MALDPLARQFRRYHEEADLSALADVFDRAAPELLRVATHLVGDPAQAEDEVQATFLTAIQRAEAFEVERRLMPWLIGILTNRVRGRLRRSGRLRTVDSSELEAPDERPGPSAEASYVELEAALDAELEGEREELRAVLVLHLKHGLAPAEIALALDRSPSTVRTQLARGLERLRRKLPAGFVASLVAVPPPRGLAALRAEVLTAGQSALAAKTGVLAGTQLGVLLLKTQHLALAAGLLGLLALGLWLLSGPDVRPAPEPGGPHEVAAAPSGDALEASDLTAPARTAAEPQPEEEPPVEAETRHTEQSQSQAEPVEAPSTGPLRVLVRDPYGAAVPGALVAVDFVRLVDAPNSSIIADDLGAAETDREGVAELDFKRRLGERVIEWLHLKVSHPLFTTLRPDPVQVGTEEVVVTLERGAFVTVSGWIGSRSIVVTDVTAFVTDGAQLPADAWIKLRDGRPSTGRIPEGRHALWLRHQAPDGRVYFSALEEFTLNKDDQIELALELHPARRLRVRLDDQVPRPVQGGTATANFHVGGHDDGPRTCHIQRVDIDADGTFELGPLPPGEVEIAALCDGWSSADVPYEDGPVVPSEETGAWDRVKVPALYDTHAGDVVLAMEPTCELAIRAVDPDGEPVEDARLQVHPNIVWRNGYSHLIQGRDFHARTDANGRARVTDLPARSRVYSVRKDGWVARPTEDSFGVDLHSMKLDAGRRTEVTVTLEREP